MENVNKTVNGLYIISSNTDFADENRKVDGVYKKIIAQISVLSGLGANVELINVGGKRHSSFFKLWDAFFGQKVYFNSIKSYKHVDFIYVRGVPPITSSWIFLLKYFKKMGALVIYEFPTYPYLGEYVGLKKIIICLIDNFFSVKFKKYVDYITTYSNHNTIFGVKTLKIINGIDCSVIDIVNCNEYHNDIHLICVAKFSLWHGYDRLIKGLYEYYRQNTERMVYLDLVGDGDVLETYRQKILQYNLQEYITCHGMLSGNSLTGIFNKADIAVCSLGSHRKALFLSSELKSREYLARGLPMVSSTKIDILPSDYQYIHYVPEDESPIDIQGIIEFYDGLRQKETREEQIKKLRQFAEGNCDMRITMKPILNVIR